MPSMSWMTAPLRSNSCNSTYRRMMTLAKRKYNMDDSILMQIMVEAYPIIVFTKQLEDRSRKIMEIIEGEDYQDGRLIAHSHEILFVVDSMTGQDAVNTAKEFNERLDFNGVHVVFFQNIPDLNRLHAAMFSKTYIRDQ